MSIQFKKHMIHTYDDEGSFRTLCGIDESCSESFWECPDNLVSFGSTETDCKTCNHIFFKMIKKHDKQVKFTKDIKVNQTE